MLTRYVWDYATNTCLAEVNEQGETTVEYTVNPQTGELISERRDGEDIYHHYDGDGNTSPDDRFRRQRTRRGNLRCLRRDRRRKRRHEDDVPVSRPARMLHGSADRRRLQGQSELLSFAWAKSLAVKLSSPRQWHSERGIRSFDYNSGKLQHVTLLAVGGGISNWLGGGHDRSVSPLVWQLGGSIRRFPIKVSIEQRLATTSFRYAGN